MRRSAVLFIVAFAVATGCAPPVEPDPPGPPIPSCFHESATDRLYDLRYTAFNERDNVEVIDPPYDAHGTCTGAFVRMATFVVAPDEAAAFTICEELHPGRVEFASDGWTRRFTPNPGPEFFECHLRPAAS